MAIDQQPSPPAMQPAVQVRRSSRRTVLRVGFVAWAVVCLVAGSYLMSAHLLTLPAPEAGDTSLAHSALMERRPDQRDRWFAIHLLDMTCKCSMNVLDHLIAGPRPIDVAERIVLIGEVDPEQRAAVVARGFDLEVVTSDQLVARYRIEAAPLMVVIDPSNGVRYVGGYTTRKQAADIRDISTIAALRRGEQVAALPTFGCAVGRELRSTVDPFGIRNWK